MSSLHRDRSRAESFGSDAERYDRHRPSYPSALIEWLTADGPGSAIDVGCGTGRVAQLLGEAGWHVVGVEPDERMAAVARGNGVAVEVARFEEWTPSVPPADLVCAGQSWHWVDPAVGYRKAADLLRPGGRLAVFWNAYRYEPAVLTAIAETYRRLAPHLLRDSVSLGTSDPRHARNDLTALAASGLFGETEQRTLSHQRVQALGDWLDELPTHSDHQQLDPEHRTTIVAALRDALSAAAGETITVHYDTLVATGLR